MSDQELPLVKTGNLNHIGLVVENIEEAVEFYSSVFGLGPFSVDTYTLESVSYRGKPVDAVMKAAFAFSGDFMIELVEVVEGETPHTEFFRARGDGVQHMAFPVDDMETSLKRLAERGIEPIFEYKFIANDAPVSDPDPKKRRPMEVWEAYLDTEGQPGGTVIQLMQIKELSEDTDVTFVSNPAS
ncbi:MAG: VOC family protein [Myxococcales bacterium]|nr:VOC family protein [Myxococcales bacterium]